MSRAARAGAAAQAGAAARRPPSAAGVVVLGLALGACGSAGGSAPAALTDFDREHAAIEAAIKAAHATGAHDATVARLLLIRSGLTGEAADDRAAAAYLETAIARRDADIELLLLRARLDVRGHRLDAARGALERLEGAAPPGAIGEIAVDIDVQDGRYAQARVRCARLLASGPHWAVLARLAEIEGLSGSAAIADRLYAEAQSGLTAKAMRSYSWLEAERGRLDQRRGRLDEAGAHYRRAARAYSGYWLVEQRQAELLGARGLAWEAASAWARLVERSPRPEFRQAYGATLRSLGRLEEAAREQNAALAGFLDSARRGEPRYFHHLAGYYADVVGDGDEAVRWARRDLALRRGPDAWEELAGALARAGRREEAATAAAQVLGFGLTDPWLVGRAEAIQVAARAREGGSSWR